MWNYHLPCVLFVLLISAVHDTISSPGNGHASEREPTYTCDELIRWLGSEKHYSNSKKEVLFGLLLKHSNCNDADSRKRYNQSTINLQDISYGWSATTNTRSFFHNPLVTLVPADRSFRKRPRVKRCIEHDSYAVAFLSNFSINNNFSHFLHGLLRLFCSLIDARIIVYDQASDKFIQPRNYTIWLDEYFRLSNEKSVWLQSFGGTLRSLSDRPGKGECVSSSTLLYGSGCVRLLPPEKWFGYPGCRAGEILPAFGKFMRQRHMAIGAEDLRLVDEEVSDARSDPGLRVAFAVRAVSAKTGTRTISNLQQVQSLLRRTQHVRSSMENVTFEHLDVPSTVRYMAGVHIFVSVHGAGMTNMFFMNPGSAVVEIIPYPLCNCRSPDYFYGQGGYYHGSAVAQGIKHYPYCVQAADIEWHSRPNDIKPGSKCSWKHLHAVKSVHVDPSRFVSVMRNVERDLVVSGTIVLTRPIINTGPHANG